MCPPDSSGNTPGVSDITGMLSGSESEGDAANKGAQSGMNAVQGAGDETADTAESAVNAPTEAVSTGADDFGKMGKAVNDFGATSYEGNNPDLQLLNEMVKMAISLSNTMTTIATDTVKSGASIAQNAADAPIEE